MDLSFKQPLLAQPDLFTLQSDEIGLNWTWIELFLHRVDADWTIEEVRVALETAQAQLWGLIDGDEVTGILVTRIDVVGGRRRGLLWIAAGRPLEAGLEMYRRFVEPWFKQKGCEYSQVVGRKGWARVLKDYEETGIILEKPL